jgi:hypothetical protein
VSTPDWIALGAAPVQNPPVGLSLPASPLDGDEYVLVDSITNPTFNWRFKYMQAIADAYKWMCIGGDPAFVAVDNADPLNNNVYGPLATPGPSFTIPRAGIYLVEIGFQGANTVGGGIAQYMSYDIGATAAVDADWCQFYSNTSTGVSFHVSRPKLKTILAANTALVAKYRLNASGNAMTYSFRWMRVTPKRVA